MFYFKFSNEDDKNEVLEEGPFYMAGKLFIIRSWTREIEENRGSITTIPIWVKMFNVPKHLWSAKGFSFLASSIGKPVCMDKVTERKQMLTFAMICVDVPAEKELPKEIKLETKAESTHSKQKEATIQSKEGKGGMATTKETMEEKIEDVRQGNLEMNPPQPVTTPRHLDDTPGVKKKQILSNRFKCLEDETTLEAQTEKLQLAIVEGPTLVEEDDLEESDDSLVMPDEVQSSWESSEEGSDDEGLEEGVNYELQKCKPATPDNTKYLLATEEKEKAEKAMSRVQTRGLNDPKKVVEVRKLINTHNLKLVGLVETKVKAKNTAFVQRRFDGSESANNNSQDHRGRIWVLWDPKAISLKVLEMTDQVIHCHVEDKTVAIGYVVSIVYGRNNRIDREKLWRNIVLFNRRVAFKEPLDSTRGL
ncbi:Rna exonuclease [Thalictrum thalictroides]|uniref:Rna exonuclease n=1 Tax=Thalictrum thalictroides TaxID=46969 RepID=A0A7J6VS45_THATH|nr:Rna exonuclease [Thalictrum thalictroides]